MILLQPFFFQLLPFLLSIGDASQCACTNLANVLCRHVDNICLCIFRVTGAENDTSIDMETNYSDIVGTTASTTLAPEDIYAHLKYYNHVQALRYFPVFVFLTIIMIVGTLGNLLVIFVYCKRFRKTSSNYFIVAMAMFDLLACLIGLPTELYDLMHSFSFENSTMCKLFRYSEAVVVYGSAIILIEIAFDRYFKICKPLWMIELYKIKAMCIAASVAAVIISIPALELYGISRTPTPDGFINGYDCSIAEKYKKKTFANVYYGMLTFVFFCTVVILSALYIRIWVEIKRRKQLVIGDHVQPSREEIPMDSSNSNSDQKTKKLRVKYCSEYSDEDSQDITTRVSLRPRLQSIAETMSRIRVSRTTIVLFAVTVAFVISYLPGIIIMVCRSSIKDLEENQTIAEQVLSKLFSKFYFLNNAINPVIYSFLNASFRRRCAALVKKMVICRRERIFSRPTINKTDSQKSNKSSKSNKLSNKSTKHEVL